MVILFAFQTDNRITYFINLNSLKMCVQSSESWLICQCSMWPNNGTMGAEPRVRRSLTQHNNHLLINSWFLSYYVMKFNHIFHKYQTELFWFDGIIFVSLIRTEILHFNSISLVGRTLGTPVYLSTWTNIKYFHLQVQVISSFEFQMTTYKLVPSTPLLHILHQVQVQVLYLTPTLIWTIWTWLSAVPRKSC